MTTKFLRKEALEELIPSADYNYFQVLLKIKRFGVDNVNSLKIILGLTLWLQTHFDAAINHQINKS